MVLGLPKTDVERLRRRFSLLKSGLFGVAVLAVTVFLTATDVVHDLRSGWALQFNGEDVSGQVTGLRTETKICEGRFGRRPCRDLFVAYAFNIEGQRFSGESLVADTLFQSLSKGDAIVLRYANDDPRLSTITIFGPHRGLRALGYCVFLLVASVLLLAALSSKIEAWYRITYLLKVGMRRSAEVTRYANATYVSDGSLSSILWQDETGATGQSRMMAAARLPDLGAKITVYADPEAKLPTIWEGEVGKG
ncbi:MAG: hypothetical protein CFE33_06125 [Pseudorhodobacter sp. PARRP1]|nr:MAG: hypothetical protein CFE33_06125 [Pseudorhodobacter sp. PARRP1]